MVTALIKGFIQPTSFAHLGCTPWCAKSIYIDHREDKVLNYIIPYTPLYSASWLLCEARSTGYITFLLGSQVRARA